jgi:hypothetical protein
MQAYLFFLPELWYSNSTMHCLETVWKRSNFFILPVLLTFCFWYSSCKNSQSVTLANPEESTLRAVSDIKETDTLWTRELESTRLGSNIKELAGIDKTVKLTPQSVAVITGSEEPVYPYLEDFGSLDTSSISSDMRTLLDGFCTAVIRFQPADQYMVRDSLFSLILFNYDLVKGCQDHFGVDLRQKKTGDSEKKETVRQFFTSWLYGAPYIDDTGFEIPVRLICGSGSVDLDVFITTGTDTKINQLRIVSWRNSDGK